MNKLTYIDLFAGAGGMSEGFTRQGFLPIAHVEENKAACFTLKTRIAFHYLGGKGQKEIYYSYIKGDISRDRLYSCIPPSMLKSVINARIGNENHQIFQKTDSLLNGKSVDLIIGGPPCQAYSIVGRAPLQHKNDDERTTLYIQYGRFLKKYKPKVFVFENVPGILTASKGQYFRNLQKYYKRLGYKVEAQLLNAFNYGVVQNRERVIIIGWQKELDLSYPEFKPDKYNYRRDDIFMDLPHIKSGETKKTQYYIEETNEYLKNSSIRDGVGFISQHFSRPHNERDLQIYRLAIEKYKMGVVLKNNQIPDRMRTQLNVTDFLDRFKVVGSKPHTMIAHIAKDGHHYIHPDIEQLRSISVREAARIQSFPDDYYFEGTKEDQSRTPAFRQIGNAVPPLLAEKIAQKIKEILND